jgi:hypothetical protein
VVAIWALTCLKEALMFVSKERKEKKEEKSDDGNKQQLEKKREERRGMERKIILCRPTPSFYLT